MSCPCRCYNGASTLSSSSERQHARAHWSQSPSALLCIFISLPCGPHALRSADPSAPHNLPCLLVSDKRSLLSITARPTKRSAVPLCQLKAFHCDGIQADCIYLSNTGISALCPDRVDRLKFLGRNLTAQRTSSRPAGIMTRNENKLRHVVLPLSGLHRFITEACPSLSKLQLSEVEGGCYNFLISNLHFSEKNQSHFIPTG